MKALGYLAAFAGMFLVASCFAGFIVWFVLSLFGVSLSFWKCCVIGTVVGMIFSQGRH